MKLRPLYPEADFGKSTFGEGRGWGLCCGGMPAAPHVVVLLEECVVLHSPLLQLHVQAAPIDGHHLADTAGPQDGM